MKLSQNSQNKRKHSSPSEIDSRTSRRRYLSSSLPDLSDHSLETESSRMNNGSDANSSGTVTPGSGSQGQPPFIQSKGQTFSQPEIIRKSVSSESVMTSLVPLLVEAIKPTVEQAVQAVFSTLQATIQQQGEVIESQKKQIEALSSGRHK